MSSEKVSELDPASAISSTDIFYIVQSGTSKKVTAQKLIDLLPAGPQGDQGEPGDQGVAGSDGAPGPEGGSVYDADTMVLLANNDVIVGSQLAGITNSNSNYGRLRVRTVIDSDIYRVTLYPDLSSEDNYNSYDLDMTASFSQTIYLEGPSNIVGSGIPYIWGHITFASSTEMDTIACLTRTTPMPIDRGIWTPGVAYSAYDLVTEGRSAYRCVTATNNDEPAHTTGSWELFAGFDIVNEPCFSAGGETVTIAENTTTYEIVAALSDNLTVTLPHLSGGTQELIIKWVALHGHSITLQLNDDDISSSIVLEGPTTFTDDFGWVRYVRISGDEGNDSSFQFGGWALVGKSGASDTPLIGFSAAGSNRDWGDEGDHNFDLLSQDPYDTYPQRFGSLGIPEAFVQPGTVVEIEADFVVEYGGGGGSFSIIPAAVGDGYSDPDYQNIAYEMGGGGTSTIYRYTFKSRSVALLTDGPDLNSWGVDSILWATYASLKNNDTGDYQIGASDPNNATFSTPKWNAIVSLLVGTTGAIGSFRLFGPPIVKIYKQTISPQ